MDDYLDALCKEIAYGAEIYKERQLDTVYIGGGTPTTLEPEQLDRLLTEIKRHFDLSKVQEFTVEAGRPDSITREKLEVMQKAPRHPDFHQSPDHEPENTGDHRPETYGGGDKSSLPSGSGAWF